jgi:chromosome segregation ATPase
MNYEQAIKVLQDNVVVIAEMERRQSAMLREHAEMLHKHDEMLHDTLEFRRRTDQNLAEITDKLNGLIGYVAGMPPPRPS